MTDEEIKDPLDRSQELEVALHKLHEFTCQNATTLSLYRFLPAPLKKTLEFAKKVIHLTLWADKTAETESSYQHELLKAVETIRGHYLLIQKLTNGTPTQQKLAEAALSTIKNYNQAIVKTVSNTEIAQFCKHHLKALTIDLPKPAVFEMDSSKKFTHGTAALEAHSKKIGHLIRSEKQEQEEVTPQEADAFRMKAITLLRNHGIRFGSVSEELNSLRTSPIQTIFETSSAPIVSMQLILNPFPGQVIKFKGSFQRDTNKTKYSIPIPNSFQLSATSKQTGFPDPSQNNGWALHDCLMPECPARIDQMPLLQPFYDRKKQLADDLLPQGKLYMEAKEILNQKKNDFNHRRTEFLDLHHTLAKCIYRAAPVEVVEKINMKSIACFYQYMEVRTSEPFDFLCECFREISHFISAPHLKLQTEWTENPLKGEGKAKEVLYKEFLFTEKKFSKRKDLDNVVKDFILCMGTLLGAAGISIILQYYSEYIECAPPFLNDFEQKVQASVYKQLDEFLVPIDLKKQLETDIELFQSENLEDLDTSYTRIVNELEVYYNSRYYLRVNR